VHLIRSESVFKERPSANRDAENFARVIQASVDEAIDGFQSYRHNRSSVGSDRVGVRRVRLCTDRGASSNGLRHVVAPLSLLE